MLPSELFESVRSRAEFDKKQSEEQKTECDNGKQVSQSFYENLNEKLEKVYLMI